MKKPAKWLCCLSFLLLGACTDGGYYLQAIKGQISLLAAREPITKLLKDETLSAKSREQFQQILALRDFASMELSLPQNDSYRSFVQLNRPYPLWNLVATPEFSLKAKNWCFPIAGCVSYRGYFAKQDALDQAAKLQQQHYDTLVAGVPAYSTLTWFDDPVLSSFSHWPTLDIARLIFHELAHQQLYLPGDSDFSEAFATSVALAGTRRWLDSHGTSQQREQFERRQKRQTEFIAWAKQLHQQLKTLYTSDLPVAQMRTAKVAQIRGAKTRYAELKKSWGGYSGYDGWLTNLNNARLASLQTYQRLLPAFAALLEQSGDFPGFYAASREISRLEPAQRKKRLAALQPTPAYALD